MRNERHALLLILLLSALLAVPAKAAVTPGVAAPPAPLLPPLTAVEEDEGDEGEDEPAEPEDGDEEAAEDEGCEKDEACEPEAGEEGECLLSAAAGTVAASPHADRLRVAIRYSAFRPAVVAVSYQVRAGGRNVRLGGTQAHFGRKGVFRDTIAISGGELAKVFAAREVAIGLHAINAPSYCRQVFQQRLTAKRSGSRLLFS